MKFLIREAGQETKTVDAKTLTEAAAEYLGRDRTSVLAVGPGGNGFMVFGTVETINGGCCWGDRMISARQIREEVKT